MKCGGRIELLAGNGQVGSDGDGGPARQASLTEPVAVAVAADGHVFVADAGAMCVRAIEPDGTIHTVVGGDDDADPDRPIPDGAAGVTGLLEATGLALGLDGRLYLAVPAEHRVRVLDLHSGLLDTVAGCGRPGPAGDGGPARSAELDTPLDVAFGPNGDLFLADAGNGRVRRVRRADGRIETVVGGAVTRADQPPGTQSPTSPPEVALQSLAHIALGPSGTLYLAEGGLRQALRALDATCGMCRTLVEPGSLFGEIGGLAAALDVVYVSDGTAFCVRCLDPDRNRLSTVAGDGRLTFDPDCERAEEVGLCSPRGLALGPSGELVVTDCAHALVWRIWFQDS